MRDTPYRLSNSFCIFQKNIYLCRIFSLHWEEMRSCFGENHFIIRHPKSLVNFYKHG